MGKVGVFLSAAGLLLVCTPSTMQAETLLGIVEWDGPCGRGEDGSRGVRVSGFQVGLRVGATADGAGNGSLKPVFIPVRADDLEGCGTYRVDLRQHFPRIFPLEVGERGPIVSITVKSVGAGGLVSRPAGCFVDPDCPCGEPFIPGDANNDSSVDISDAICFLSFLFSADCNTLCNNAADLNEDFRLDIADPIHLLNFLFP